MFEEIDFSAMQYPLLKFNSIIDILNIYQNLSDLQINIKAMQDDNVDVDEFFCSCKNAILAHAQLKDIEEIDGINELDDALLNDIEPDIDNKKFLQDGEKITNCQIDIIRAQKAAEELEQISPELVNFNIEDALSNAVSKMDVSYLDISNQYLHVDKMTYKELSELIYSIKEWNSRNRIIRLFYKIPLTIEKILPNRNKKTIKTLIEDTKDKVGILKNSFSPRLLRLAGFLEPLVKLLNDTQYTLNDVVGFYKKAELKKSAYDPLKNDNSDKVNNILNKIFIIYEIISKYNICSCNNSSQSISDISVILERITNHFEIYNNILHLPKNSKLVGSCPELLTHININISNRKSNNILLPIVSKYSKYLCISEKMNFISQAKDITSQDATFKERVKDIKNNIEINSDVVNMDVIKASKIAKVLELLKQTQTDNLFSDCFYNINPKETVSDWLSRIKNIINFQDTSEFDGFVSQNKFITRIRELLEDNSSQLIDQFLQTDSVTYQDFSKKIINDLVNTEFNSFSAKERQGIPLDFLIKYKQYLNSQRKNYLLKGLNKLRQYTAQAQKDIKSDKNWNPGGCTMEKLQNNTELISNVFPIIAATPQDVARYISAQEVLFDYVIFDEASQLLPGQALPSIYRAKKAIIVGDPHQMPPPSDLATDSSDIDDDFDFEEDKKSILNLAIALQTDAIHLKVHYRSKYNILFEPSREAIYKDYGVRPIFEARGSGVSPIGIHDDLGENDGKNFDLIIEEITKKLCFNADTSFCLLFANGKIRDKFKRYIDEKRLDYGNRVLIFTVRDCQGIERDHSILYLHHYKSIRGMWFFNEKRGAYKRLNVTITRQIKSLKILMANPKEDWLNACQGIISNSNETPNRVKSAKLLQSLIENSSKQMDERYMGIEARDDNIHALNIDSPLTRQLCYRLVKYYDLRLGKDIKIYCEVGWKIPLPDKLEWEITISDKKGIGELKENIGFRLDIGIYSPNQKRFVLGIEMDGSVYHKGYSRSFSDAQRQETLEKKGWEVYRIWSSNWLNDVDREFNKLVSKIDGLL